MHIDKYKYEQWIKSQVAATAFFQLKCETVTHSKKIQRRGEAETDIEIQNIWPQAHIEMELRQN